MLLLFCSSQEFWLELRSLCHWSESWFFSSTGDLNFLVSPSRLHVLVISLSRKSQRCRHKFKQKIWPIITSAAQNVTWYVTDITSWRCRRDVNVSYWLLPTVRDSWLVFYTTVGWMYWTQTLFHLITTWRAAEPQAVWQRLLRPRDQRIDHTCQCLSPGIFHHL